jgi:hypothetical protein
MRQLQNWDWIIITIIPIVFITGIILFFVFIPVDLMTISNFIAYASSWSTVVMVLLYIFTNSRQLRIMQKQLSEMNLSRNVQYQPLIYPKDAKIKLEAPEIFSGPESDFKSMEFMSRLFVDFEVRNLGNGPAVGIDFVPKVISLKTQKTKNGIENKVETEIIDGVGRRIECISLKEGDSKAVTFVFFDSQVKVAESLLDIEAQTHIACDVVFKNALGMTFREKFSFPMYEGSHTKTLKQCLRTARTEEIDFGARKKKFDELMEKGQEVEAHKIFDEIYNELKERCKDNEEITFNSDIASGSFSISPISSTEYETIINDGEHRLKRILERLSINKSTNNPGP